MPDASASSSHSASALVLRRRRCLATVASPYEAVRGRKATRGAWAPFLVNLLALLRSDRVGNALLKHSQLSRVAYGQNT